MTNKIHLSYLDSIRGLAALTVITEHYVIAYGLPCQNKSCQEILDFPPLNFWWDGSAAVSMFFVLSGLVLSLKYFRASNTLHLEHFDLAGFILARLCRIWLPYLIVLSLSAVVYLETHNNPIQTTLLAPSEWLTGLWGDYQLTYPEILRESFLLMLPATNIIVPQAWTLNIELVLSLLLPLGLVLIKRSSTWLIFFTLFTVSILSMSVFLFHFAFGLLIARYHLSISQYLATKPWQRRLILILGVVFYTSGNLWHSLHLHENLMWITTGIGAACILMFALGSIRIQQILSNILLRQLGKISYSAYLIHMLILLCITPQILRILENTIENFFVLWFFGYLLTVALVQLLSFVSYYLLETPSISLGYRLKNWTNRSVNV